jgi:AAA family ATP:ADP antiporter
MLLYSFLVDRLKKYQVFLACLLSYSILALIFGLALYHPVYGVSNTNSSPFRILGWLFYIYMDLYMVFIISTFWAFSNSINDVDSAKKNYGFIAGMSKLGGIIAPLFGWMLLNRTNWSEANIIPGLVALSGLFLAIAALCIYRIIKTVPKKNLHGYEAAYQVEKEKRKAGTAKTGIFEGVRLMVAQPYVLGIFGLVYAAEIILHIIDYQMQLLLEVKYFKAIGAISSFMFIYTTAWQTVGFVFAFLGVSFFVQRFDIPICLISVPIFIAGLVLGLLFFPSLATVFIVMVFLRAIQYGFNHPVREMLYIPTVKDIKFKSKAWIDSFGRYFSKASGATVNLFSQLAMQCGISLVVAVGWIVLSVLVGQKYKETVDSGKVIGEEETTK